MAASVTPPGLPTPAASTIPHPRAPVRGRRPSAEKWCNEYIPNDSLRNRFFWAMRYIAANGFYVIIDDHLAYDTMVRRERMREAERERRERERSEQATTSLSLPRTFFLTRPSTRPTSGWPLGKRWPPTSGGTPCCATG